MGQERQAKAKSIMLVFGLVFGLGALLTCWLAAEEWLIVWSLQGRGVAVQGEVFDFVSEPQSGTGLRGMGPDKEIPLIRFQTAEGRSITVRVNALAEQFPRGTYPLRYLPDDPATARVEHFITMWLWSAILGACAALLLFAAILVFRASRRIG